MQNETVFCYEFSVSILYYKLNLFLNFPLNIYDVISILQLVSQNLNCLYFRILESML